ncbi:hypothetical protein L3Q82_026230, partial [Scortum barcoo]
SWLLAPPRLPPWLTSSSSWPHLPPLQSSLQLSGAARLSAPAASAPRQAVTPTAGQTLICDFYSLKGTLKLLKLQSIWCLLWSAFRGLAPLCLGIVTLRSGQNMDPADQEPRSAPVQQAVTQQGILLGQHDANIRALISANQTLAQQVASLSAQLASLQAPAAPTDQRNQPETGDDQQRDLQAVPPNRTVLRERLLPGLKQGSLGGPFSGLTFSAFLEEFRRVFESPATPFCASSRLFTITQDRRSVADYTLEFRTLGGRGGLDRGRVVCRLIQWAPMELADVSAVPLQFPPRFLIPPGGPPPNSASRAPESPSVPTPEEPMQVGGAHLSPEERNRRLRKRVSVFTVGELVTPCLPVPGDQKTGPGHHRICFQLQRFSLQALIDSGAEENFIDEQAAEQAGIPSEPLERPRNALAVDGRILAQTSATPTTWCGSGRGTNGRQPSTPPWATSEYLVMPFGLTNAPAVFQALINDVLRDFLNRFVFVYLDDILIYSRNLPDHQLHVRQVLQRLLENRLFVKKEKCEFHASQVDFLGFIIKEGCVQADPAKVRAVAEWPIPTNRKLLQRFLGFANFYRRFIRNYSQEAAPLTALTSPSRPFVWSEEAEKAFNRLRTLFTTAPVLVQPDPAQQFVVEVDASDIGVGAVLSQRRGSDGRLHPCAFFSRRLSPAEANYDVGNRELLAVKMALEEWRHWLEGSTQPFVVWTDHKNLAYIQTAKRLNSRQARWALFFSRFDFVPHLPPRVPQHQARRPLKTVQRGGEGAGGGEHPSYLQGHRCYHLGHRERRPAGSTAAARPRAGDLRAACLSLDAVRSQVLQWAHSSKLSCHPGINRTISLIKRHFWWRNMEADIRGFVQACTVCGKREELSSTSVRPPSAPFCSWAALVPHRPGFCHRQPTLLPLAKLPTARETADLLANHVVRLHGIPRDIVSDRGPQFISQVWKSFCTGLGRVSESHLGVPSSIKRADGEDEPGPRVSATLCHGRQPEYLVTNHHCFHARNKSWPFPPSNIISNGVRRYGKGPRPPWRPPFSGIGDRQTSTDYLLPSTP